MRTLFANAYIVTMDDSGTELPNGWLLVDDGFVVAVGEGNPPPAEAFENLGGALVTPGLVNTHHHLYQTLTRTRAQQADLFTWLRELYPLWSRVDRELGVRSVASRGSMDVGDSDGGLPSAELVDDPDCVVDDNEGLFTLH